MRWGVDSRAGSGEGHHPRMKVHNTFRVQLIVDVKGASTVHIPRLSALIASVMLAMADPCVVTAQPVSAGHAYTLDVDG